MEACAALPDIARPRRDVVLAVRAALGRKPRPARRPPRPRHRGTTTDVATSDRDRRRDPDDRHRHPDREREAMTTTMTTPQLALTRVFDAARALVYNAFTDPDQLAEWWGPLGNSLPRDEIDFDVRSGGHERWTEVFAADPHIRVNIHYQLAQVVDGELLDGTMHVTGQLPEGLEPFETRVQIGRASCRERGESAGLTG